MAVTRYRDGDVTITLDGALEELVNRAIDAAGGACVRVLQRRAGEVAVKARADWYGKGTGVRRRTGRSGDVQVVTTVSNDEVRVSVGSADTTLVGGKPRAVLVHRAKALSTIAVEITRDEYRSAKAAGGRERSSVWQARRDQPDSGVKAGLFYRRTANPAASDGKFLIPELVRKPATVALQLAMPEVTAAFAAQVGGR